MWTADGTRGASNSRVWETSEAIKGDWHQGILLLPVKSLSDQDRYKMHKLFWKW